MITVNLTVGPNEPDNVQFGEILYWLRGRACRVRSDVANSVEVSSEYIRLIERGERSPALGTAIKMLEDYFIPYEVDKSQLTFQFRKRYVIEFTSRIQEARHKGFKISASHDKMIGQIVRALVLADGETLEKIHKELYAHQ